MSGKKHRGPVRACLIVNARSEGSEATVAEVLPVLAAQGWDVTVREKHEKGQATDLARQAVKDGYDPIVNCGGDGTLSEVVDALAGTDVAIGTIPGGTENVWSKEIDVSQRVRVAATQLVASRRVRVDVGRAEIDGRNASHFLMMAGLGADGAVMGRVSRSLKNRIGPLAVGVAAVEAFPSLKPVAVQIEFDGVKWEGQITELIVGNTRRYGGFTRITPEAFADDGLLDVCLFTTQGILGAGRQMASLVLRQHPSDTSSEVYRAAHITVRAHAQLPLQLDGSSVDHDPGSGEVRYDFSVVPRGLTILVPRTYDGALFKRGKGKKKKSKKS